ncbi:MAG: hypothetical protein HUK11_04070 [Muribaculaceae bacterium]|nr:hypothetical protein [Muribaculaceae bacterium]
MARQEKEMSVEDRLKALYHLQKILSEVDRIKTLRGELPLEVKDLEDGVEGLKTRLQNYNDDIAMCEQDIKKLQYQIEDNKAAIEKYSQQQNNVRNNREYDDLDKEINYCKLSVQLFEKKTGEAKDKIEHIKGEIVKAQSQLEDAEHVLEEKKAELNDIVAETKQDEEKLRDQAKKLENKIEARLLAAFKRIRKNARNGLGVVYVQRNACGGCFNRIPAQRQMEIKMHKKVIVCEYCGRIMVDPALAGVSEADAKNA